MCVCTHTNTHVCLYFLNLLAPRVRQLTATSSVYSTLKEIGSPWRHSRVRAGSVQMCLVLSYYAVKEGSAHRIMGMLHKDAGASVK